ncbi:MAG: DUF1549 and DUF1553 domain-containing protein [Verrucomicrobiota bacterium]|nr:DUF1549 and DUF1553 domain-containing protein [Verrucomicrobiota bacterium]
MRSLLLLPMSLACFAQGVGIWAAANPAKWAFEPLRKVAVPTEEKHPIDGFVRQRLAKAGLTPSEPATPKAMVRRLHYDLIGLPPRPEVVLAFERNPTTDAYLKLVDELLASQSYGERWARHWLDVARYGESNGFEYNEPRRNAWPYRDWVIKAFNTDMPYDEFVRMQLVGDVLKPDQEGAAAVGFLVAGMHNTVLPANIVLKQQARADELGEMMGVVGQSFLGLTIQCARCHDHKVDPISTEEYYSFAAAFNGVNHGERSIKGASPKKMFTVKAGKPAVMRVHLRGNAGKLGDEVMPAAVSAVRGMQTDLKLTSSSPDAERRMAIADWITHRNNPLFNRVIVNRIWHWHFGRGLVSTPSDFGSSGTRPSHPELIDWLAGWFRDNGYQLKVLHRLIVTSATYRQSAGVNATAMQMDRDNRFLWRFSPRRVEGEVLRDSLLFVSGALNLQQGGPGFEDVKEIHFNAGRYYHPIVREGSEFDRRTIYRFTPRGGRDSLLDGFDCPDPSTTTPVRTVTTTPLQALSLRNSPFIWRLAKYLSKRLKDEVGEDPAAQVEQAWLLCLGRIPDNDERQRAVGLVREHGMAALARVLFNSGEFVVIE